ncbi:hypothetical protein ABZP36_007453 [Zizania latifolia]
MSTFSSVFSLLLLAASIVPGSRGMNTTNVPSAETLNGCPRRCGNLTFDYPFGVGSEYCFWNPDFNLTCNNATQPPRLLFQDDLIEVVDNIDVIAYGYIPAQQKANCSIECGNISVPFPFGLEDGCFARKLFQLDCTNATSSSLQFDDEHQVTYININVGSLHLPLACHRWHDEVPSPCLTPPPPHVALRRRASLSAAALPHDAPCFPAPPCPAPCHAARRCLSPPCAGCCLPPPLRERPDLQGTARARKIFVEINEKMKNPEVKKETQTEDNKHADSSAQSISANKELLVQATLSSMFKKAEGQKRSARSPKGSPAKKILLLRSSEQVKKKSCHLGTRMVSALSSLLSEASNRL